MNSSKTAGLRLADRLRRGWYVTKVDFLAQDVPGGDRRGFRRELRADLTAAASDVGMAQAVRDVGPASVLARQLELAEGRNLPHWWTGLITFVVILYAWAGMVMATANALTQAAAQLGGGRTVTVHSAWLGTTVTITKGEQLVSAAVASSTLTFAVLVVVPLIAARAWRYRPAWLRRRMASRTFSTTPHAPR
jgi:hypothetical protein